MGLRPPKVMKNGFCSATTLNGSAALPFVISTGAPKERSGEICGAPRGLIHSSSLQSLPTSSASSLRNSMTTRRTVSQNKVLHHKTFAPPTAIQAVLELSLVK
jgi:hypothetical protein